MMRCPVCSEVYSYGRGINHTCGDYKFFFGSIFDEKKHRYQWNCTRDTKMTNLNKLTQNRIQISDQDKHKALNYESSHNQLYHWNCADNQTVMSIFLNFTESDRELIYE